MTATLHTDDGRSTLRFERTLAHPRERVWRAVTEPDELRAWFPCRVSYEPRAGAPMTFDFEGEHGLGQQPGEVLTWDPPTTFAFTWSADELRFALADAAPGTLLVFTHTFAQAPGVATRDAAGWDACLDAFAALLAGDPDPQMGDWAAYERIYAEVFGEPAAEPPTA